MNVTSHQVIERLGQTNTTELHRLRQIMGIEGQGSGRYLVYEPRMADVLVTIRTAMLAFSQMTKPGDRRSTMSWEVYREIGHQLLLRDRAILSLDVVTITVDLVITDWSTIPTGEKQPMSSTGAS